MIQCSNCGQFNDANGAFCRFCGTRMTHQQSHPQPQQQSHEYTPPRPYAWKTDEFQMPESQAKKTGQINQVQPLMNNQPAPPQRFTPPPPPQVMHNPPPVPYNYNQSSFGYGYRCPHCGTQNFPRVERKISTAGWVVFAVLLFVFFPLFWIGLLIKEDVKTCSVCNLQVT
jgi:hypothetical protein